jgi:hypothetical protein
MTMRRSVVWHSLGLVVLSSACFLGCATLPSKSPTPEEVPDRFVSDIIKADTRDKKVGPTGVDTDVILKEVPLRTPLAQARAVMESHGFKCWAGVPDNNSICLHCTADRRKNSEVADKVLVKLYYDNKRITGVEAIVEYGVLHSDRSFWSPF